MIDSGEPSAHPDSFSRDVLEFPAIIELVRGFLTGPIAQPWVAALAPMTSLEEIERALDLVREAREFLRESARPSLSALHDPRPLLAKLTVEGAALEPKEILALVDVARAADDLRDQFLKTPFNRLDSLAHSLPDFRELVKELDGKILPDGTVDSSASKELARLRHATERLRNEVQNTLEKLVLKLSREEVLQESVVTLRNDRFVLPVRAEEKRRLGGVIHGASSSGATVFMEPLETVPLNNELVELQEREWAEVQRILAEFSRQLSERRDDLGAAADTLGELDLIFAKTEFGRAYDCCLPEFVREPLPSPAAVAPGFSPEGAAPSPSVPRLTESEQALKGGSASGLTLKDLRHPLLEKSLRAHNRRSIPITIDLTSPKSMMIISGPNTGGKTVALKSIGVTALMAQAGLPVAAGEARLPIFHRVLADIGDQQSIEANLSTFSAHISNIQSMVSVAGRNDLVLLDELGGSTEPNEGAALAVAILEFFRRQGATTFVTTHHSRLKAYAAETPQAENAAMEFDEVTLQPTYRLISGLPGKSSGIDTAERLGLDHSIVQQARGLMPTAEAEASALVATLHDQKTDLENRAAALARARAELEARRTELEKRFEEERRKKLRELDVRLEQTLEDYEKKWESAIAEIRAQATAQGKAASLGKRPERKAAAVRAGAREEWNAQVLESLSAPPVEPGFSPASGPSAGLKPGATMSNMPPAVGDRVRVQNLASPGTVVALIGDKELEVEVGRLRMRVGKDEVHVLSGAGILPVSGKGVSFGVAPGFSPARAAIPYAKSAELAPRSAESDAMPPAEINVIGLTADEARDQVDKFLDSSFLAGRSRLRVVHGHGKGILMRALHEMFASHPHVEKYYSASQNEGGTGATIVELKQ